ncbi:ABC transporter substrate-binding protein [Halomicroarcula sp. S1AR25-4]|uniref:ABC transporter substrate-binding protein n=1 Tax=Haloarcula sp. S1AR25-4 TaxID=2950538 RepID=UPI0028744632|nr:ABC transporter substrate-binding protein [Halomicroarcula sp. S1AR25-4]MDS0279608.1 ABC transporter substrate-binding protein [Halomicroarcula sp. S1AR25-4]
MSIDDGVSHTLSRPTRRGLLRALGIGVASSAAGCNGLFGDGGGTTTTQTQTGVDTDEAGRREPAGEFVGVAGSDANSLNWLFTNDTTSGAFVGLTLDGAWAVDDDQNVFPLWAEPSTDDGQTYRITLRDNLRWGGGYGRMTAEDWVYMIRNVFQGEDNWAGYTNAGDWFRQGEPIPVERIDDLTFEIRLPDVDPSFPLKPVMWGQSCLPKGILETYVPDKDTQGLQQDEEINQLQYTGNLGPYTFEEWERESQYVTTRNDEYYVRELDDVGEEWRNAPYFDSYTIRVISEESSRLNALREGEVTSAGIPPQNAREFQELETVDVYVQPQPFVQALKYNMRANGWRLFRKVPVRQAFVCAVNKQTLAGNLYRGFAEPAFTMQPRFSKWYVEAGIEQYRFGVDDLYGPDPARRRMRRAIEGTDYRYDGDTLLGPDGSAVTLSLYASTASRTNQTLAELVAQEVESNLGIGVRIETVPGNTFQQKYAANSPPRGTEVPWSAGLFNGGPRDVSVSQEPWDMSVVLGFNTYPRTPSSSATFFRTRGNVNYYGYVPESNIPELYAKASRTVDEERRRELFAEVFEKLAREQPFGFLLMPSNIVGAQDELVGPTETFASGWNSQTYYFES